MIVSCFVRRHQGRSRYCYRCVFYSWLVWPWCKTMCHTTWQSIAGRFPADHVWPGWRRYDGCTHRDCLYGVHKSYSSFGEPGICVVGMMVLKMPVSGFRWARKARVLWAQERANHGPWIHLLSNRLGRPIILESELKYTKVGCSAKASQRPCASWAHILPCSRMISQSHSLCAKKCRSKSWGCTHCPLRFQLAC